MCMCVCVCVCQRGQTQWNINHQRVIIKKLRYPNDPCIKSWNEKMQLGPCNHISIYWVADKIYALEHGIRHVTKCILIFQMHMKNVLLIYVPAFVLAVEAIHVAFLSWHEKIYDDCPDFWTCTQVQDTDKFSSFHSNSII